MAMFVGLIQTYFLISRIQTTVLKQMTRHKLIQPEIEICTNIEHLQHNKSESNLTVNHNKIIVTVNGMHVVILRTIEGIPWKHKTYFLPRTSANNPDTIVPTIPPMHNMEAIHDISSLDSAPLLNGVSSSDCNSRKLDDGLCERVFYR